MTAPARPKLTAAVADKVIELHRGGLEPAEIGRELDLSRMEVISILGLYRMEAAEDDTMPLAQSETSSVLPFAPLPAPIEPPDTAPRDVDTEAEAASGCGGPAKKRADSCCGLDETIKEAGGTGCGSKASEEATRRAKLTA